MEHTSLRGLYGAPKPKKVATVSPVIDDNKLESEDESAAKAGNNSAPPSSPYRVNEEYEVPPLVLQTKSSLRPASSSSRFSFGRRGSNQEDQDVQPVSYEKYAVVGQKQQWRRNRSQRHGGASTIKHVTEAELDANGEEREELGERASSYLSSGRLEIPTLPSSRLPSSIDSQLSSRESSRQDSTGRRSQDDGSQSEREMFVVTRQKKSKYAAKLYMPGQNPLYLGRYRSEEAARMACESAFTTITTPRK